jgi:replicative DNA helicase
MRPGGFKSRCASVVGTMTDPAPPHDTTAEESVLGACLIDPEAFAIIGTTLRTDDFYTPAHRDIYGAMLRLTERNEPTDFTLVCGELGASGIAHLGGLDKLTRLLTVTPTAIHVAHYAGVVARTAAQRRLISTAGRLAALAYGDVTDPAAMFATAEDWLQKAAGPSARPNEGPVLVRDILNEYLEGISVGGTEAPQTGVGRVLTGYYDIDRILGGFARGDLVVLAARPSVGKSALSLSIARNVAVRFGQRVLFDSVEMSKEQIAQRLLSSETGISSERLREGRITEAECGRLYEALEKLAGACFWVDCQPEIALADLRARAKRIASDQGIDLVVVDYLGLVQGSRSYNRVQEVSEISASLKGLAREINAPVLALSQLSRGIEQRADHTPLLSDLRDSGSIEQDADAVVFISRREDEPGVVDLTIAKHRNGPTGTVSLVWNAAATQFADLTRADGHYR